MGLLNRVESSGLGYMFNLVYLREEELVGTKL